MKQVVLLLFTLPTFKLTIRNTSLPYFGVKLSCVCLMFAFRKKIAYSYPNVNYSGLKVTYIINLR